MINEIILFLYLLMIGLGIIAGILIILATILKIYDIIKFIYLWFFTSYRDMYITRCNTGYYK